MSNQRPSGQFGHSSKKFNKSLDTNQGKGVQKKSNKHASLSSKIRGVERLLKLEGLDPRVRVKKEKELKELQQMHQQHKQAEIERKYAVRYHKIRFFERVKIERHIQKLERKQAQAVGLSAEDAERLEQLRDDLQYVLHFPRGYKYVSLLKNPEDPQQQAQVEAERARLRELVHKQLQEAALLANADEGAGLLAKDKKRKLSEVEDAEDADDFFLDSDDGHANLNSQDFDVSAKQSAVATRGDLRATQPSTSQPLPPKSVQKIAAVPGNNHAPSNKKQKAPSAGKGSMIAGDDFFIDADGPSPGTQTEDGDTLVVSKDDFEHKHQKASAAKYAAQDRPAIDKQSKFGGHRMSINGAKPFGSFKNSNGAGAASFHRDNNANQKLSVHGQRDTTLHKPQHTHTKKPGFVRDSHFTKIGKQNHGPTTKQDHSSASPVQAGSRQGAQVAQARQAPKKATEPQPLRTRAEGGRKRRKRSNQE